MKNIIYLLVLTLFVSCTNIEEGKVVSKTYEPENTSLMLIPMKVGDVTIMQQYWVTDNEDWVLTVENEIDGKIIRADVYVTKECYLSLNKGDMWYISNDCSFSDDNNTKKEAE